MAFQQVIIIGNVGGDPKFQYTQQGVAICHFNVAVNKVSGKGDQRKEKTTWFKVTVWRERAETASQYIKKGMKIMVIGEIDASAYINKQTNQPMASLELTASNFQFLDSKGESQPTEAASSPGSSDGYATEDGDLPF